MSNEKDFSHLGPKLLELFALRDAKEEADKAIVAFHERNPTLNDEMWEVFEHIKAKG